MNKQELALQLFDLGVLQFGSFTLKSGLQSPFYLDFRKIIAYPEILREISQQLWELTKDLPVDHICGVPYAALSLSSTMATMHNKSMIVKRKEVKKHGTKKIVEGVFEKGDSCVVIDDVISSGISMIETLEILENEGLAINHVLAIVDRQQGGKDALEKHHYQVHCVYTIGEILDILLAGEKITQQQYEDTLDFIHENHISFEALRRRRLKKVAFRYSSIERKVTHPISKQLLKIISHKRTNLCCSGDVKTKAELLDLADKVGPHICMLKTHIDNIQDFDADLPVQLKALAQKHNFLLFEDRKFADIGHIAMQQFTAAPLAIADWADIVTVHVIAGSSSVEALKATGKLDNTALIVVAEMSTKDTLTSEDYVAQAFDIALHQRDVVMGVVAQQHRPKDAELMLFSPGINMATKGDAHGQTYNHPQKAFADRGVDVMIVGRGIYLAEDPAAAAAEYQKVGWQAYLDSLPSRQ